MTDAEKAIRELLAENDALKADTERLDWIERQAQAQKIEIARSILGRGYEFGLWPECRAMVGTGSLREAIDAAKEQT